MSAFAVSGVCLMCATLNASVVTVNYMKLVYVRNGKKGLRKKKCQEVDI